MTPYPKGEYKLTINMIKHLKKISFIFLILSILILSLSVSGNIHYGHGFGDFIFLFLLLFIIVIQIITIYISKFSTKYKIILYFQLLFLLISFIAIMYTFNGFTFDRGSEYPWDGNIFFHATN